MFCSKCGKENDNQNFFCRYCGTQLSILLENENSKEEKNRGCDNTSTASDKNANMIDEIETIINPLKNIEIYYQRVQDAQNRLKNWKQPKTGEKLGIPAGIGVIAGFAVLEWFIELFKIEWTSDGGGIVIWWPIIGTIIFACVCPFYAKYVDKEQKKQIKRYENIIEENQKLGANTLKKIQPILLRTLPRDYWYSEAATCIYKILFNGRADSLKEAINLYEEDMHRMRMENIQQQILIQNQKQTTYAAITAFNTLF